uniref:Uncharacterized protein n=1 Tax=Ochrobactrum phage ORM_20 TaxID=2985243 RepID=A0A9N6WS05_9VIRU|nr:hypothetical protein ORM20_00054 [Ochrobactrum phage ORM_20]
MTHVGSLKTSIWSRFSLWPIFEITEFDDYGNEEKYEIDSMNLKEERDEFFVQYTRDIFYAAIMYEDEIEVEEQNSITDTSFSSDLFVKPEHDHEYRRRLKIDVMVKMRFVDPEPEEDYNDDD